ncbi:iron transporter [Rhodovibrio salinarum]|nr:iron transporter [Rhodovibrio salinarum]
MTAQHTDTLPPSQESDEADRKQLEMAKAEGAKYKESLNYMVSEVAHTGGSKRAGDYIVAFAQEEAEGMYVFNEGALEWRDPGEENCHIEVAVLDATDQRFIPGLTIHVTVRATDGGQVASFQAPFLWHPGLYHYGRNIQVPGDGTYDLQIHIEAPTFMRHDWVNGKRFAEPVTVAFENIEIKTGQD